jgi:hypothetical protein
MTPLPGGFPQASVIPNAASARLTRAGLDFIAANAGGVASAALGSSGGQVEFTIPKATKSISIFDISACSNPSAGQCQAEVGLGSVALHVDAVSPDKLSLTGTVPVKVADLPVVANGPLGTSLTFQIGIGNGSCQSGKPQVTPTNVPVSITLPLIAEWEAPRAGYTKVDTAHATITANIDSNALQICGSGISGLFAGILSDFKSFVLGLITSPLESTLQSELAKQLCEKPQSMVSPSCPTGSAPSSDGTECLFSGGTEMGQCVPMLLGTDGHYDLGALIAKFSPGVSGGIDFVLAAGGNADAAPDCQPNQTWTAAGGCKADPKPPYAGHTPNGLTLGLLGGALPNPQTSCVPVVENPIPQGIPIPDELMTDSVSPWPTGDNGPDFGLALAGRFLDYAATSAFNSGVLCLGITTDQVQALSTGYVSAVIPSVKNLTFEPGPSSPASAMALVTRPQKPPTIAIGGGTDITKDPLLKVSLPGFAVDFYVWNYDRFVRAFTYTADLTIPVNLQTGKDPTTNPTGGILPVLGDLTTANASVTNSQLLTETPKSISDALSALLGGLVGQFLGKGLTPIDLSSALSKYGLGLTVPEGGFRKLTKGSDDFLALFADMTTSSTLMTMMVHPSATIVGLTVNRDVMSLETANRAEFPTLRVALSAAEDDGTRALEYSWWIDDQPHAAWTTERDVVVGSQYLFLQGKHVLYTTARVVGHPETEGETPAASPFIIDVIAPSVSLERSDSGYVGRAYDFVSEPSALQARYRIGANGAVGAWTAWQPLSSLPTFAAESVDLQVIDEAGNVGESNGLIRGEQDPTLQQASSACGCSTPGTASPPQTALVATLAAIAAVSLLARRRKGAAIAIGSIGVLAATTQGCACGDKPSDTQTGCGQDCNQTCGPPNQLGLIGSYTSVAAASDGTMWVAGYDDADVTNGLLYGDLVVGKYDASSQQVAWQTVDGLPPPPAGSCAPNPKSTWRDGLTDPGPDVGLWTSIQVDASGNPMLSYYDATNSALKFASSQDGGKTWSSHTVMQAASSDIGRYSKLAILSGVPTVAFLVEEPGTGGWARSRTVLATASVANPQSASDWTFQDAVVDEQTPCRARFCANGEVCVKSTNLCQPTVTGCTPADCGASTAGIGSSQQSCVSISGTPTCEVIDGTGYVDSYPDAEGDYITMANGPQGVGLVVYDRTRGNLVGAANQGGGWNAVILDGQMGGNALPTRVDTGDVGIGASLAITSEGDWHVTYVNGWTESLEYLRIPGGNITVPQTPEVVDDGTQVGGQAFPDGVHIVGDDSSVTVASDGTIRVVYQDATAGTLREALGVPATPGSMLAHAGNKHTWTVKAIAQPSRFAGFFPHYVPETQSIENWFRATDDTQSPALVTGNVVFVSP